VIIDGNNLIHAMHEHAPIPAVGRETLVRIVDEWARRGQDRITIVFDGPPPRRELAKQMDSTRVFVRFSAPATADDVIVDMVQNARHPTAIRVITSDTAIRHEAKYRRCRHTDSASFVRELFATTDSTQLKQTESEKKPEKPKSVPAEEVEEWMDVFNSDDQPSPDDLDLMND
jgi:predicted RNA-binding protein with PIN domain